MPTMEFEGHIVEFVDSGALRMGYVRKRELRKVHIIDRRGRQSNVPANRIVVVHTATTEEEFPRVGQAILDRVLVRRSEIDAELLWELVHGAEREFRAAELAETYFGETSPEAESAVFRALDEAPIFFKRKGSEFQARSADQVASERVRRAREQERERFRTRVADLLRPVLRGSPLPDDPDWGPLADRIELWFRSGGNDEVGSILASLAGETRAREAAYELLIRSGHVDDAEDRFLLIQGVSIEFPAEAEAAAEKLRPYGGDPSREDWSDKGAIAIDDDDTREVDDALTIDIGEVETVVGIHIADVSAFVEKGDPLDLEASRRSTTIYLPNSTVTMFPNELAADLASLIEGQVRPAMSLEARFDSDDSLSGFRIFRSTVRVGIRLTYEEADRALEGGDPDLGRLHRIACRLHEDRAEKGAQTYRRRELKVKVRNGSIDVSMIDPNTPSRVLVSEMMILANRLAADHASAIGLPVIFRTQEAPSEAPPDTAGLPEPLRFERLRKTFKRSRLSVSPAPHAGLGLDAYTQMSSPIRRYADLVTERQFGAALTGTTPPYDRDELLHILTTAEIAESKGRRLEQSSTTYWVLTYLSRYAREAPLEAIVMDHRGNVALEDYAVRGKVEAQHHGWSTGDRVVVTIEDVDPASGSIRFRTE